jgi:hypothetical protein
MAHRGRQPAAKSPVLHSRAMHRARFFFAFFWFSPLTGGWKGKRA